MACGELPEDVIREILSLLPVKSLLRFRCVCKLWCALIQNPSFIALHLNRASLRKSDYLVVNRRRRPNYLKIFVSIHYEIEAPPTDLSTYLDVLLGLNYIILLGPSNGLICLTDIYDHIVLCNPATRAFKALPVPQFPYRDQVSCKIDVGFGFDPKTSDYKVVRIVKLIKGCPMVGVVSYKTQVYSLSSNSWRQIEIGARVSQSCCSSGTLFNGAFHWFTKYGEINWKILAFHMSDEVFQRIPLPDICCSPPDQYCKSLSVLNESLALIRYEDYSLYGCVDKHFDIWVMNEYGVKESWTLYCKIGPLLGIDRPLVFWKNSELLLETCEGQLVSCNLFDQNVKHFQVDGVSRILGVVVYSESLVPI